MTQITVIGGGIIGLTSALALLEAGFKNVQVIAESFDQTTSHVAGAIWRPFSLPANASTNTVEYVHTYIYKYKLLLSIFFYSRWGHITINWLKHLMKTHGEDVVGIRRTPGHEYHDYPSIVSTDIRY